MILTKNNLTYSQGLIKGNVLLKNTLLQASVILYNSGAGGSCFASGTVLFAMPNDVDGASNETYLVTSKESLQLYNIDAAVAAGNPAPSRPAFSPDTGTSAFNTLLTAFKANAKIIYNQKLNQAPTLPPTPNAADIDEVIFFDSDNGWQYDTVLLKSTDATLYSYVTDNTYAAWGDVSGWSDLTDMPDSAKIKEYFSTGNHILLTGFGNTAAPNNYSPVPAPTVQKTPAYELTFTPPAATVPPPDLPLPGPPAATFVANSIQIMNCSATHKSIGPDISLWPNAVPGPALVMTKDFTAARTCTQASTLKALDCTCLSADTGGSAYAPGDPGMPPNFLGVISGVNGSIESQDDWKKAWTKAQTEKKADQLVKLMDPYLPWPPRNQVITLLTKMVDFWPLEWPVAPEGFYQNTTKRQAQAKKFVGDNNSQATSTNVSQALNVVFSTGGKDTPSSYDSIKILHASAGKKGTNASCTIFYQQTYEGSTLISVQIIAIGSHSSDTSYTIEWVWDEYTSWYAEQKQAKADAIAAVPDPGGKAGKAKIKEVNTEYDKIMGTEEIQKGVIYTLSS